MKIENIKAKIWEKEAKEEARKASRKDLEELYVHVKYNEEKRINPIWGAIALLTILALIGSISININMSNQYEGTEYENYRTLGTEICKSKSSELKKVNIEKQYIIVKCYEGTIEIPKERW